MKEIKYPASKKLWICQNSTNTVLHIGETEPNQVTTTPFDILDAYDTESQFVTAIASKNATLFPAIPALYTWCELNKVYAYGANKAKCVQGHWRTADVPETIPALWIVIPTVVGYPVWKQPIGSTDAYAKGDRVHFTTVTDPVYESLIAANAWSPTVYPAGWKKL